jgi:hypothetical protein
MENKNLKGSSAKAPLEEERPMTVKRLIKEHRPAAKSYQPSEDANFPDKLVRCAIEDLLEDLSLNINMNQGRRLPVGFMPLLESEMERVISGKDPLGGDSDVLARQLFAKVYTTFTEEVLRD